MWSYRERAWSAVRRRRLLPAGRDRHRATV